MLVIVPTLDREKGQRTADEALLLAGLENARAVVAVDETRSGWTRNVNRHLPLTKTPSVSLDKNGNQTPTPGWTWTADDDICILNDDCVVRLGWLATLWDELEQRNDCWFAGPSGPCRTPPQNSGTKDDERRPMVVSHCAGFCLVVRRAALQALGPLDGTFRHYGSDVDWQWRAQRDFGKRTLWVPGVYVDHELHAPLEPWYTSDNFIFWERWNKRGW